LAGLVFGFYVTTFLCLFLRNNQTTIPITATNTKPPIIQGVQLVGSLLLLFSLFLLN